MLYLTLKNWLNGSKTYLKWNWEKGFFSFGIFCIVFWLFLKGINQENTASEYEDVTKSYTQINLKLLLRKQSS